MPARALSPKPQTQLPHPGGLQDTGLPRASDQRHPVNPSIINTSPGLSFSDWDLPNPLIIPVRQVDAGLGIINGRCLPAYPHKSTPAINPPVKRKTHPHTVAAIQRPPHSLPLSSSPTCNYSKGTELSSHPHRRAGCSGCFPT